MAQTNVYSMNAVGYVNVTVLPGFNMIACPLQTGNNTLGSLIPNTNLNAAQTAGIVEGAQVYKWTGTTYQTDVAETAEFIGDGWAKGGTITMNPGEAIWFKNPSPNNLTFTFIGTVPQGSLCTPVAGPGAFSMISSQVPQAGDLMSNLNLTNLNNGDQIYIFNPSNQMYLRTWTVDLANGASGYVLNGFPVFGGSQGDPFLSVGQGFWYRTASTSPAFNWTRTFSVNQ
jgi:hypothetical protein